MCGIAGIVGEVDESKVDRMLRAISHRGPDDRGVFVKGNVGLGNNRLAVIDLSPNGHQPMFDDKKSVCIVYNGEIYNFQDVRNKLRKEYKFKSNSDTEVIIYAYKKWGTKCLNYLNGMFAFVIYDIEKNLLFGARDRLGEKPLKYFFDGKEFVFASEIKAILSVLKAKPGIDLEAVNDFLTLQYVPAPRTGFKNVYKLPPASYFIFKDSKLKIYNYWNIDFSKKLHLETDEWIDVLKKKIDQVVKDRMVSDVPIGAFLSGGIDSSVTTAFMARNSSKRIKTFSIGFRDSEFDETEYSRKVSKLYKTDHSYIKVNPKTFRDELPKAVDYFDEPFADNSLIPTLILSRFTRKEVTVALSGDGGDENFAGYDRYHIVKAAGIYKNVPRALRNSLVKPVTDFLFIVNPNLLTQRIKTFSDTIDAPFYKSFLNYRSFFSNEDKEKIFERGVGKMLASNDTFLRDKGVYNPRLSAIDNALKIDINSYLPEDLLFKTDIASMSASLEVRSPLLDYELMELTSKMPDHLKINGLSRKYIFKNMAVKMGILPSEIVNRPKRGFVAPIGKWLKGDLKRYTLDQLNSKKFRQSEIFDDNNLDQYIEMYYSSNLNYHNNMFALLMLSSWMGKYF
jgi:asparagine synthase (glutamine-hydrolysing)